MTRALKDLFTVGATLSVAYHKSREDQEVDIEGLAAEKSAWAAKREKLRDQNDKLGASLDNLSDQKLILEHQVKPLTAKKEALLKDKEDLLREKNLAEKCKKQLELGLQTEKGKRVNLPGISSTLPGIPSFQFYSFSLHVQCGTTCSVSCRYCLVSLLSFCLAMIFVLTENLDR
jgi:hypothetical protein